MGTTYYCIGSYCGLSISDCISILSIIVNSIIAIWIVYTIQNKLNNKRVLKDYFIEEIKVLRNEYKSYLTDLICGKIFPKNVIPWHHLMSIKINDLMDDLENAYSCDKDILKPYQVELRELITESPDFITQYNSNYLSFNVNSINSILKFQQNNNKLFSKLIVTINNK